MGDETYASGKRLRPVRLLLALTCLSVLGALAVFLRVQHTSAPKLEPVWWEIEQPSNGQASAVVAQRGEQDSSKRTGVSLPNKANIIPTPGPEKPSSTPPRLKSIQEHLANRAASQVAPPTLNGTQRTYHANGVLESEGEYRKGEKTGFWTYYTDVGIKELEGEYDRGAATAVWTAWYESGHLRAQTPCREGEFHGACIFWNDDGSIDTDRSGAYEWGKRISK